jgi:hypothetical protein
MARSSSLRLPSRFPAARFVVVGSLAFLFLITTACDELVGTCCCLTADSGASVKNRKACTDGGGICTNNNVCAQSPTPSPSPSQSPSPNPPPNNPPVLLPPSANLHFRLNSSFLPGFPTELSGHMQASQLPQRAKPRQGLSDPTACDEECATNGPFCLKVNLKDDNGLVPKVEKARKLIMDKTRDHIATKQFMDIFEVATDPCDRKDTVLAPTVVKNSGQSCVLNSSINNQDGTFAFTVHLPSKLEGSRDIQGDNIVLLFPDATTSPDLTIGDVDLNHDFGGRVRRATANHKAGILSTERGCIAVRMLSDAQ